MGTIYESRGGGFWIWTGMNSPMNDSTLGGELCVFTLYIKTEVSKAVCIYRLVLAASVVLVVSLLTGGMGGCRPGCRGECRHPIGGAHDARGGLRMGLGSRVRSDLSLARTGPDVRGWMASTFR